MTNRSRSPAVPSSSSAGPSPSVPSSTRAYELVHPHGPLSPSPGKLAEVHRPRSLAYRSRHSPPVVMGASSRHPLFYRQHHPHYPTDDVQVFRAT